MPPPEEGADSAEVCGIEIGMHLDLFLERVVWLKCSLLRETALMHGSAGECFQPKYWVAR